jgi:N utilization substance protein A
VGKVIEKNIKDRVMLKSYIDEFIQSPSMDKQKTLFVLETTLRSMIKYKFGHDANFEILINLENCDIQIWRYRQIVEDSEYKESFEDKIPLSHALKIQDDFQVGEKVAEEIKLDSFGRRSVHYAINMMNKKILPDIKNQSLIDKYQNKVGDILRVKVLKNFKDGSVLFSDDEEYNLYMPFFMKIKNESFIEGECAKVEVQRVGDLENPVIVSRVSDNFLKNLFESEIPEIKSGLVEIIKIARFPGIKSKVVVASSNKNENVFPLGACIGPDGSRIKLISREINGERIDVIQYSNFKDVYINRIFGNSKISSIKYISENHLELRLAPEEISKLIGTNGINIKLGSKLLNSKIDIYREVDE